MISIILFAVAVLLFAYGLAGLTLALTGLLSGRPTMLMGWKGGEIGSLKLGVIELIVVIFLASAIAGYLSSL